MLVCGSYEKRSVALTVFTFASDSVATSTARFSESRSSTSTSLRDPCHSAAFAMSAAISYTRSIGASISTLRSPLIVPIAATLTGSDAGEHVAERCQRRLHALAVHVQVRHE